MVYGWVRLKHGKMASRLGNVVLGEDLLNYSKKEITKILEKSSYDEKDKEEIAEKAAVGAVKYSFLKPSTLSEIAFDIKESVSLEGNSGPYIQYTYARTQSVLSKAMANDKWPMTNLAFSIQHLALNEEELSLLRSFVHFPEVVEEAAKSYSPNLLCNYLYDLAQKFNLFYQKHRILDEKALGTRQLGNSKKEKLMPSPYSLVPNFRLALTSATGQILKNGLNLLGIQAPERM